MLKLLGFSSKALSMDKKRVFVSEYGRIVPCAEEIESLINKFNKMTGHYVYHVIHQILATGSVYYLFWVDKDPSLWTKQEQDICNNVAYVTKYSDMVDNENDSWTNTSVPVVFGRLSDGLYCIETSQKKSCD